MKRRAALAALSLMVTSTAQGAPCVTQDALRAAAYTPFIQLVLDDIRAIDRSKGDAAFNAALNNLSNRYAGGKMAGDVRKLIGLGLFTAMATKAAPAEGTFQLACESARRALPPKNVLDPLVCAAIAVDHGRRDTLANRKLASDMLELAKANLIADPDPVSAREAISAVTPSVLSCLSQQ